MPSLTNSFQVDHANCIQPMPERPHSAPEPVGLHASSVLVAEEGEWSLRRSGGRPRRWFIVHPVHGWMLARATNDVEGLDELRAYAAVGGVLK